MHVGETVTSMTAGMLVDEAGWEFNLLCHLFDRAGVGQDVVYGVLLLATHVSPFMAGNELVIDGRLTAHSAGGFDHFRY